jgi:hypothetical protein
MTKTFAQQINDIKNMLTGLTAHSGQLNQRGITPEFMSRMTTLFEQANQLERERNALKARSQEATFKAGQVMTELEWFYRVAKKLVRIELPAESWLEFGFRKGEFAKRGQDTPEQQR